MPRRVFACQVGWHECPRLASMTPPSNGCPSTCRGFDRKKMARDTSDTPQQKRDSKRFFCNIPATQRDSARHLRDTCATPARHPRHACDGAATRPQRAATEPRRAATEPRRSRDRAATSRNIAATEPRHSRDEPRQHATEPRRGYGRYSPSATPVPLSRPPCAQPVASGPAWPSLGRM